MSSCPLLMAITSARLRRSKVRLSVSGTVPRRAASSRLLVGSLTTRGWGPPAAPAALRPFSRRTLRRAGGRRGELLVGQSQKVPRQACRHGQQELLNAAVEHAQQLGHGGQQGHRKLRLGQQQLLEPPGVEGI